MYTQFDFTVGTETQLSLEGVVFEHTVRFDFEYALPFERLRLYDHGRGAALTSADASLLTHYNKI